ncbi:MAG: heterodisulfide reductase-related iron-sulfur binding cluster [Pseudomonadota bacterium]|nr:heterodisulfide reductase-related iron-sulfur binding cluster [Pseudomonadota bacterium]
MAGFDYSKYFGPIEPLADAIRNEDRRCWENGTGRTKTSHDYVLYLGCNVLRTVALAETITAILTEMGVKYVALGGPSACCGIIHHSNSDIEVSKTLTKQTLTKFESFKPKAVLTYCPSCHAHMDYALSATDLQLGVPYLHVTEFIVENLARLKFRKKVQKRVVFHGHGDDHQARRDARFAQALLSAIPGLEVIDATGAPVWGHDCGNLQIGLVGPEKHRNLVNELFKFAQSEKADAVAVLYHSCYRNLCPAETTHGVRIVHYTSLIAESLGLPKHDEAYKRLQKEGDPEAAFRELAPVAERRGLSQKRLKRSLDLHFG